MIDRYFVICVHIDKVRSLDFSIDSCLCVSTKFDWLIVHNNHVSHKEIKHKQLEGAYKNNNDT